MSGHKENKGYKVQDIAKEFAQEFPELKDTVTIIDPRDFNSTEEILDAVRPHYETEAEKKYQAILDGDNAVLKASVKNKDSFINNFVTIHMLKLDTALKENAPMAMVLGVDEDDDSLGGDHRLVFGGNEDLNFNTLVWRSMAALSTNTIASISADFKENLKERMEGQYRIPDSLNNPDILQSFVLDHELGHAATAHLLQKEQVLSQDMVQYWECIADSYALIRHYQRYGEDSSFGEYWTAFRDAAAVMMPDPLHWTSEAMREVMDMNKAGEIKDLSPKEAIDLAVRLADKHGFGVDESYNIRKAFDTSPLKDAFSEVVGQSAKKSLSGLWKSIKKQPTQTADNDDSSFLEKVEKNFMEKSLHRLENKDKTIQHISRIGQTTSSSAVYRITKSFLSTVNNLWPDIDKQALETARDAVNARTSIPTTEPKRSLAGRAAFHMKTKKIRQKYGNG